MKSKKSVTNKKPAPTLKQRLEVAEKQRNIAIAEAATQREKALYYERRLQISQEEFDAYRRRIERIAGVRVDSKEGGRYHEVTIRYDKDCEYSRDILADAMCSLWRNLCQNDGDHLDRKLRAIRDGVTRFLKAVLLMTFQQMLELPHYQTPPPISSSSGKP